MMQIHHTGHPIKPKSIELVHLHVEAEIAEQETHDLMVAIVEEPTVPELMSTFSAFMEILVVRAIEIIDSIEDVLACMGVNDIEENGYAHAMRGVYELL